MHSRATAILDLNEIKIACTGAASFCSLNQLHLVSMFSLAQRMLCSRGQVFQLLSLKIAQRLAPKVVNFGVGADRVCCAAACSRLIINNTHQRVTEKFCKSSGVLALKYCYTSTAKTAQRVVLRKRVCASSSLIAA
jgi:hypothetical protein